MSVAAEPKAGRARTRGEVHVLGSEIDAALDDAFEAFIAEHRPRISKRAALEWAIEEFLGKRHKWPRPNPSK